MNADRLTVFTKAYDFTLWLMNHTAKFPRSARFSVAARLEKRLLDFLGAVLRANRASEKLAALGQADTALDEARILLRLSKDMRFIALGSYEFGARELDAMGAMLGAWMKQQAAAEPRRPGGPDGAPGRGGEKSPRTLERLTVRTGRKAPRDRPAPEPREAPEGAGG